MYMQACSARLLRPVGGVRPRQRQFHGFSGVSWCRSKGWVGGASRDAQSRPQRTLQPPAATSAGAATTGSKGVVIVSARQPRMLSKWVFYGRARPTPGRAAPRPPACRLPTTPLTSSPCAPPADGRHQGRRLRDDARVPAGGGLRGHLRPQP